MTKQPVSIPFIMAPWMLWPNHTSWWKGQCSQMSASTPKDKARSRLHGLGPEMGLALEVGRRGW